MCQIYRIPVPVLVPRLFNVCLPRFIIAKSQHHEGSSCAVVLRG
jgi:hypothetical protein